MKIISINQLIIDRIGRDKIAHFSVSMNLVLIFSVFFNLLPSAILALVLGLLKEVSDRFEDNNIFSKADMLCNTLGVIAGVILYYIV